MKAGPVMLLTLGLVLLCPLAGAAQSAKTVTLHLGDWAIVWDLRGHVGVNCYLPPDAVPKFGVECYLTVPAGVRPNSYSAFVSPRGVSIYYYATGTGSPRLIKRWTNGPRRVSGMTRAVRSRHAGPRSDRRSSGHGYDLHVGDAAFSGTTPIHCLVSPTAHPVGAVECYYHDGSLKSGVRAGSYSALVYPTEISVWRYDAAGHNHVVFRQREPSHS